MSNAVLDTVHSWGVEYSMEGLKGLEREIRDLRKELMEYDPVPYDIVLKLTGSIAILKAAYEMIRLGERMAAK